MVLQFLSPPILLLGLSWSSHYLFHHVASHRIASQSPRIISETNDNKRVERTLPSRYYLWWHAFAEERLRLTTYLFVSEVVVFVIIHRRYCLVLLHLFIVNSRVEWSGGVCLRSSIRLICWAVESNQHHTSCHPSNNHGNHSPASIPYILTVQYCTVLYCTTVVLMSRLTLAGVHSIDNNRR